MSNDQWDLDIGNSLVIRISSLDIASLPCVIRAWTLVIRTSMV
jgi:hypothetical protein